MAMVMGYYLKVQGLNLDKTSHVVNGVY